MSDWNKGSARLHQLMQGIANDDFIKAAAADVQAAAMTPEDTQTGEMGQPGEVPADQAMAPDDQNGQLQQGSSADQLRALADAEPDMSKKQVLLQAADNIDRVNQPVVVQPMDGNGQPPPQEQAPAAQMVSPDTQPKMARDLNDFVNEYGTADNGSGHYQQAKNASGSSFNEAICEEVAERNFWGQLGF